MSTATFICSCVGAILFYIYIWQSTIMLCILMSTSFLALNFKSVYIFFKVLPRDVQFLLYGLTLKYHLTKIPKENRTVYGEFLKQTQRFPDKKMIIYEHEYVWTFLEVKAYAETVASYFDSRLLKKGDVVAIYMDNVPEYPMIWLGLSKLGVISSLINYNHTSKVLAHSINICNTKFVICSPGLARHIEEIRDQLRDDLEVLVLKSVTESITNSSPYQSLCFPKDIKPVNNLSNCEDVILYIYTSGTTGLPKAARMTNQKYIQYAFALPYMFNVKSSDVIWAPLPLYHTNAGINGFGVSLVMGTTFAFRKKFSASSFSKDLFLSNATVFQYLGEICRYTLAAKENEYDKKHSVALAFGGGLKSELWKAFQKRFGIKRICEYYGATEGNVAFINISGKPGAIGYYNELCFLIMRQCIVKVNEDGEILRNSRGRCIKCKAFEPGMVIGEVRADPLSKFYGYHGNEEQTNKKIFSDVFVKGDKYFNSGDIVQYDEEGFVYFLDRSGDTFRFKGENVSTFEVENVLSSAIDQKELVVYGVPIPHIDGCAGMACIAMQEDELDFEYFTKYIQKHLPSYARPVFIRLIASLEDQLTSTFKYKKTNLRKEGFDISQVKDKIFYFDSATKNFRPLDKDVYERIQRGDIRF